LHLKSEAVEDQLFAMASVIVDYNRLSGAFCLHIHAIQGYLWTTVKSKAEKFTLIKAHHKLYIMEMKSWN